MKSETLKKELCNDLVEKGKVQEGDIVKHSYTGQIMSGKKKCVEKSNEMIALTTRGDCVNDVKLVGGIGEKKSNGGTQYYEQNRIYDSEQIATAIATSVAPYYDTHTHTQQSESRLSNLRIRKLTPLEALKLMGFEKEDYDAMREAGLSDQAIYHCAGDSIVVSCLIGIFAKLFDKDTTQIIEDYVERVRNGNK